LALHFCLHIRFLPSFNFKKSNFKKLGDGLKMKAARWYGAHDVRIDDIPEPEAGRDQVKIKIKWAGICGSDLHEYLSGPNTIPATAPHPLSGEMAPITMGHEFSGVVTQVGEDVTRFKIGDRVTVQPITPCRSCPPCRAGLYNLCENISFIGITGGGGAFAEYICVREEMVHLLPEGLSFEKAALVEPLAVGYHSLEAGQFRPGMTALVAGAGPIGLAVIMSLKACGAGKIIAMELSPVRREYALAAGADYVLDPTDGDPVSRVREITNGGADIAFETTGNQNCFYQTMQAIHFQATDVVIAIWGHEANIDLKYLVMTEKNVVGSNCCSPESFPKVIDLLSDGKINPQGYITKRIALDDIVAQGFETLAGKDGQKHLKIIVTPEKELL
jgi:(R,R)-butanediol dehydrogenase/meso-butanediol dehydrogenase/diacetyl reductase